MAIDTTAAIAIYTNEPLRQRVQLILTKLAIAVLSEAGSVQFHDTRVAWANRVLNDPEPETRKALRAALATVTSFPNPDTIGDAAIEAGLTPLVNALAGASEPSS